MLAQVKRDEKRTAAAAVEFAIVCPLLFGIFLGMIEVGRAMMASGAIANAARIGARSAALTGGNYSNTTAAVATALGNSGLPNSITPTVTVNGTPVSNDSSFLATATPGATVSVQVSLPYSTVSWLPGGVSFFVPSGQPISATCSMVKEG